MEVKRRLAAIMAADVVGYSRLMGRDEEGTVRRVKSLIQDIVRPAVAAHGGRVVKTMGDGFLAQFNSVVETFHCAVKLQQAAIERNAGLASEDQITLRIGINLGDIIQDAGDVFGDGVNIAARLESLAKPGGICVSGRAYEDLRRLKLPFTDMGDLTLKNIAQPVRAYALLPHNPNGPQGPVEARAASVPPAASARDPDRPRAAVESVARSRRPWIAAGFVAGVVIVAAAATGVMLSRRPAPPPNPRAFVTAQIGQMPCSWLRVSDHSSVDGVEIYKLSGSSSLSPDAIAAKILKVASAQGVEVDRVIVGDVAPLYASQCAWIDKLKDYRYNGVPRFTLEVKPLTPKVTRAALTLDEKELGPSGAVYGIEPSGAVERIIDRRQLAEARPPAVIAHGDGAYTLNLDIDHVGWNGIVFMESRTPVPEGVVERTSQTPAEREGYRDLAKAGGWRFELAWFQVGG